MAEEIKCKQLKVVFSGSNSFGKKEIYHKFMVDNGMLVEIHQLEFRQITIVSNAEKNCRELYDIFSKVELLLFLFEGQFFEIKNISFEDSNDATLNDLFSFAYNCSNNRLSYYKSADFCKYSFYNFISFEKVITTELFYKWKELYEKLDISKQVYFYAVSDIDMPIDIKCAFLIELSESIVGIVKEYTQLYGSLNPGERGTSLKMCIEALIEQYGTYIFDTEKKGNYAEFLKTIVNSRVRIMHIKNNQNIKYLDGKESLLYAQKFALLYRRIIFEILGIDEELYKDNMIDAVERLNSWSDILNKFMLRIQ